MMLGNRRFDCGTFSLLCSKEEKKRTIVVGLKSDNNSRDMLLRVLSEVARARDKVLAVHVEEPNDTFDPNTFYIHEDLCNSNQVDFLVKVCTGDSYIAELTHQVIVNYATILTLGCSLSGPKELLVGKCIKLLPPTCTLLVVNIAGRVVLHRQGIYMRSSLIIESSTSPSKKTHLCTTNNHQSSEKMHNHTTFSVNEDDQRPEWLSQKFFQRLAIVEANGLSKRFMSTELNAATNNFSPAMLIAEGTNSMVYKANLRNGRAVAVKVLKNTHWSTEDLFQEVEILSSIKHENIVRIVGYCICRKMIAVVYDLLNGSLKQKLRRLKWSERMKIAVNVARALEYLHHCCNPPIIHRDVKSSNILLSNDCQSLLSDFGAATIHNQSEENSENMKPLKVVGTFGYLAPEYMMCGKGDEKILRSFEEPEYWQKMQSTDDEFAEDMAAQMF